MSLTWWILLVIVLMTRLTPVVTDRPITSVAVWILAALMLFQAIRKVVCPRIAVVFREDLVVITGVRPGWWKLFQLWNTVPIPWDDIISIRVGKIRDTHILGVKTPPLGEPSRGGCFQNFLWIRYKQSGQECQIYYPHINDIQDSQQLVRALREKLPTRIEEAVG